MNIAIVITTILLFALGCRAPATQTDTSTNT